MQQQSVMPMPLTDIVRLHSREYDGGGVGSASVTDFLQWPVDLGTPLVSFKECALTYIIRTWTSVRSPWPLESKLTETCFALFLLLRGGKITVS